MAMKILLLMLAALVSAGAKLVHERKKNKVDKATVREYSTVQEDISSREALASFAKSANCVDFEKMIDSKVTHYIDPSNEEPDKDAEDVKFLTSVRKTENLQVMQESTLDIQTLTELVLVKRLEPVKETCKVYTGMFKFMVSKMGFNPYTRGKFMKDIRPFIEFSDILLEEVGAARTARLFYCMKEDDSTCPFVNAYMAIFGNTPLNKMLDQLGFNFSTFEAAMSKVAECKVRIDLACKRRSDARLNLDCLDDIITNNVMVSAMLKGANDVEERFSC